jgi:hypothetical protein
MLKKTMIWVAASIAVSATVYIALKPKRAEASSEVLDELQSIFVLGDSQTKRHIGEAYRQVFDTVDVQYFGKEGATHIDYVENPDLLENLTCADLIVIQLGDNGVRKNKQLALDFIEAVRSKCPNSALYWAGPMKAVAPTVKSNYVTTTDSASFKYLPKYNDLRRRWDSLLRGWLIDTDVTYVSNIELQETQPLSSAFSDNRGGDGIHLQKDSAIKLAELMKSHLSKSFPKVL